MPIEIIIKNDASGSMSAQNPLQPNENVEDEKKISGKKDPVKAQMINLMKSQAKTWALAGVQAYTKYTGNSLLQDKISLGVSLIDDATSVAMGLAIGGPIGGIVASVGIASKYGMQAFNQQMEIATNNRTISINNVGLGNRNMNGGRYGA